MTGPPVGPTEAEIEELLGAYALDALEPEEAALVEEHLRTCVRCSAEVARHHEVAGLMANSGGDAPGELWDRIAERLEPVPAPSWDRLAARLDVPDRTGAPEAPAPSVDPGPAVAEVVPIERAPTGGEGGRRPPPPWWPSPPPWPPWSSGCRSTTSTTR